MTRDQQWALDQAPAPPRRRPAEAGGERGPGTARRRGDGRDRWPASPLVVVARAFAVMVAQPTPYRLDGTGFDQMPDEPVAMDRVRDLLLSRRMSPAARDAVWRELVTRARRPAPDGQAWMVIAAGVALPGLRAAAAGLTRGWRGETADIDAEVLAGFVARLKTVDLTGARVVGRLIDAGVRDGRRARALAGDLEAVRVEGAWSCPPAHPWDHPDWVLARAVAAGVLDRTEARLIGATRLEDLGLAEAAAALRVDPDLAAGWRGRAEPARSGGGGGGVGHRPHAGAGPAGAASAHCPVGRGEGRPGPPPCRRSRRAQRHG